MCIIAIKPAGIKLPDQKKLTTMWANNSDGAGFMYPHDGQVLIQKGYMTLEDLLAALKDISKQLNITATPIVLHFRIGTSGGNTAENTHPFPVTSHVAALQKTRGHVPLAVAHNGIIDIRPRKKEISDTMEYTASILAPLYQLKPDFYKHAPGRELIYNTSQSKLVFMDGQGHVETVGDFHCAEGILYSNYSYLPYYGYKYWDMWDPYGHSKVKKDNKRTGRLLMFLTDEDGYIITSEGDMYEAFDFLIDSKNNLYVFDYKTETAEQIAGTAYTHEGGQIPFSYSRIEYVPVRI